MQTNHITSFNQEIMPQSIAPASKPKDVNSFSDVMNETAEENKSSVANAATNQPVMQSDQVTLSSAGIALSEPKYTYDPTAIYTDENTHGMVIYEHPIESILPENLALLDLLKSDKPTGSTLHREEAISIVMRYGDKEVFSDIKSVETKRADTLETLKQTIVDMEKSPERYPHLTMFEEGDRAKMLEQKMGVLINHYRERVGLSCSDEYKGLSTSSVAITSFDSKAIMEEYRRKMAEYQDRMIEKLFA